MTSLQRASDSETHTIDLRVNGTLASTTRRQVYKLLDSMSGGGVITEYGENRYPCVPRIESVAMAQGDNARWWAKLDDDIAIEPGCWDLLIECIQSVHGEHEILCAMADPGGGRGPQFLRQMGSVLQTIKAPPEDMGGLVSTDSGEVEAAWSVCEFVGDGCTVFDLRRFEVIGYDEAFALGGADIDLAMQAKMAGFKSLFCDPPIAEHHHKRCAPEGYDRMRYDAAMIAKSSRAFRRKWGLECSQLVPFERRG